MLRPLRPLHGVSFLLVLVATGLGGTTGGHPSGATGCEPADAAIWGQYDIHLLITAAHSLEQVASATRSIAHASYCGSAPGLTIHALSRTGEEKGRSQVHQHLESMEWLPGGAQGRLKLSYAADDEEEATDPGDDVEELHRALAIQPDPDHGLLVILDGGTHISPDFLMEATRLLSDLPPSHLGWVLGVAIGNASWPVPVANDFLSTRPPGGGSMVITTDRWSELASFGHARLLPRYRDDATVCLPRSSTCDGVWSLQRLVGDYAMGRGLPFVHTQSGTKRRGGTHSGQAVQLPVFDFGGRPSTRAALVDEGLRDLERVVEGGSSWVQRKVRERLVDLWQPKRRCVLDTVPPLQGGAQNTAPPGTAATEDMFLTYTPHGDLSEQLIAMSYALAWSHALGRTMVIPRVYWPSATHSIGGAEIRYSRLFDLRQLRMSNEDVRIIEVDDFEASTAGRVVNSSFADLDSGRILMKAAGVPADISPGVREGLTSEQVSGLFGGCSDQVLHFSSLFQRRHTKEHSARIASVALPAVFVRKGVNHAMLELNFTAGHGYCLHLEDDNMCDDLVRACPGWARDESARGRACTTKDSDVETRLDTVSRSGSRAVILSQSQTTEAPWFPLASAAMSDRLVHWGTVERTLRLQPQMSFAMSGGQLEPIVYLYLTMMCASSFGLVLNSFRASASTVVATRKAHFDLNEPDLWMRGILEEDPFVACPVGDRGRSNRAAQRTHLWDLVQEIRVRDMGKVPLATGPLFNDNLVDGGRSLIRGTGAEYMQGRMQRHDRDWEGYTYEEPPGHLRAAGRVGMA